MKNLYECEMRGKIHRFRAYSAMEAVEKMGRKFHWTCHVKQIDPETRGEKWAHGWADGLMHSKGVPEWFDMAKKEEAQ